MTDVLKEKDSTQRKEGHVKMGAEIGVMQLQGKEQPGLLATTRNQEKGMVQILRPSRGTNSDNSLASDFQPP